MPLFVDAVLRGPSIALQIIPLPISSRILKSVFDFLFTELSVDIYSVQLLFKWTFNISFNISSDDHTTLIHISSYTIITKLLDLH